MLLYAGSRCTYSNDYRRTNNSLQCRDSITDTNCYRQQHAEGTLELGPLLWALPQHHAASHKAELFTAPSCLQGQSATELVSRH